MSKPVSKMAEPSIDEMLSSIREAIHEETVREAEEHARTFKTRSEPAKREPEFRRAEVPLPPSPPKPQPIPQPTGVSGSMRELRVSLQPADKTHSRGTVTARSEDFLSLKNKLASLRQSSPQPSPQPPSQVSAKPASDTSMADVMSGDVRLEDALARTNSPNRPQHPTEPRFVKPQPRPVARQVPAANTPVVEPQMRSTINDVPEAEVDIDYGQAQEVQTPLAPATEPEPVAAVVDPVPAEPEFEPPSMVADPAILEYTEVASDPHTSPRSQLAEAAQVIEAQPEAVVSEPAPIEQARALNQHEAPVPVEAEAAPMMFGETIQAANSAFELLSKEIFSKSSDGELALEDSARDMIKPMLKKWLDDNLPTLVERLVREEIERVARKGGR